MRQNIGITTLTAVTAVFSTVASSRADASWGCEVLLCAAASNPSWHGVATCVPPMTRLVQHLSRGGEWPSCPSADARLGFERWSPCREGFRPAQRGDPKVRDDAHRRRVEICRSNESQRVCGMDTDDEGTARYACRNVHGEYVRQPHPRPYYYAIPSSDGFVVRYHFALGR